ncbi:MAG: hypothetical protein ACYCOU_02650 [Sulfobacillus sp.]
MSHYKGDLDAAVNRRFVSERGRCLSVDDYRNLRQGEYYDRWLSVTENINRDYPPQPLKAIRSKIEKIVGPISDEEFCSLSRTLKTKTLAGVERQAF